VDHQRWSSWDASTMRKRAETNTQRHSAHEAIIAKQLAMNFMKLGNDGTPSLPLTRPTDLQTQAK
jgi:hypothetical protein